MATSAQNSHPDSDQDREAQPSPKDGVIAPTPSSRSRETSDPDARTSDGTEPGKSKAASSTTNPPQPGMKIRDYELLEMLGQGGMGSVWKAKHTRLKRLFAIKLLPQEKTSDEAAVARFNREMEAGRSVAADRKSVV